MKLPGGINRAASKAVNSEIEKEPALSEYFLNGINEIRPTEGRTEMDLFNIA
jgi:hypothetical protein